MITVNEEPFDKLLQELKPMLDKHWEELAVNKEERPLDVDYERYSRLSQEGLLKILTLRKDGVLVGYASFIVSSNLHYKGWVNAVCDVYYVLPEVRKEGLGTSFFKEIVQWLKFHKVNSIYVHDKLKHSHSKLFESLGFTAIEQTYEMVI